MRDQECKQHRDAGWEFKPGSFVDEGGKDKDLDTKKLNQTKMVKKYIAIMPKYKGPVMRDIGARSLDGLKAILADYVSGAPVGAMESWAYERGSYEASGPFRLRLLDRSNKHGASITKHSSFQDGEREILKPAGVRYRLPDDAVIRQYTESGKTVYEVEVISLD